jgi:NADPH:quinone reductase-like Zn-dependent oxidoreductase
VLGEDEHADAVASPCSPLPAASAPPQPSSATRRSAARSAARSRLLLGRVEQQRVAPAVAQQLQREPDRQQPLLRAEGGSIAVRDAQDQAALASDAAGFVNSVDDTVTAGRRLALFGERVRRGPLRMDRAPARAWTLSSLGRMKAVTFSQYGGPEVLEVTEAEEPHAGPGQVRIRVAAAAINPIDWKIRSGAMAQFSPVDFPVIDGREAAGVVDEVGEGVAGTAVGDEVFGWTVGGAAAEYAVLTDWEAKPAELSFEQAAGLPVAVETPVRVFSVLGGLGEGQTIVINGAAGGVGAMAVQLAKARGARVIGTASERNHDYLRGLGAEPTTYGDGLVERVRALAPGGVDLAFDTAGKGDIPQLIELTGDPAKVATIADFSAAQLGVKVTGGAEGRFTEALGEACELARQGRLQVSLAGTYPFSDAPEAHRASEAGHARGKLVLVPGDVS